MEFMIHVFTQYPHCVLFFSITERSVLMALDFHYKYMVAKVAMQRRQQFFASLCHRKN